MFGVKSGSHFNEVELGEITILSDKKSYVAHEHPQAEYQYRGVFVAITDKKAMEKRP